MHNSLSDEYKKANSLKKNQHADAIALSPVKRGHFL